VKPLCGEPAVGGFGMACFEFVGSSRLVGRAVAGVGKWSVIRFGGGTGAVAGLVRGGSVG